MGDGQLMRQQILPVSRKPYHWEPPWSRAGHCSEAAPPVGGSGGGEKGGSEG